jgi:hypothetical protein
MRAQQAHLSASARNTAGNLLVVESSAKVFPANEEKSVKWSY